ncbi:MAG: 50S ribosomal protein L29 [Coriobacteriia bacterium]|nr:50S ribosomal protein L29 [Coriobacteriia bacterium]MBN2823301.1 50S ribosomal protein L29 [Coriobacteriia bacterium]
MKATEIRDLQDSELLEKIKESRAELFNLRFQLATGQLDNPQRINAVKKVIARLHTELRVREIDAARSQAS